MAKELEVKVLDVDINQIQIKLKNLNAVLIKKELQVNTLIDSYETPIKTITDGYLRIRESKDLVNNTNKTTLTFKKNVENRDMRENIEYNVGIENRDSMVELLKALGYNNIKIGYKERTSYNLNDARIDIDIWDKETYPHPYIEIEVKTQEKLYEIINILGISRENISTKSILELRKELNLE